MSKPSWRTGRWHKLYTTTHWVNLRKAQLINEPLCRMCKAKGLVTPAVVADHVTRHHGNPNAFFLGELQSLCKACHDRDKHIEELKGYRRDVGVDGFPIDPNHPAYADTNNFKTTTATNSRR
jgi:5-methylcytosine-specific restriction endonuclease McrA